MMLLRRGRVVQVASSTIDIDVTYEIVPGFGRRNDRPGPWRPPVEVYETGAELVVRVEIAGLADGLVQVIVERDVLEIRGDRPIVASEDPRLFHESRIRYGPFLAAIHVPFPVDDRAATADYQDGLLTVRLPRQAASRIAAREQASYAESGHQGDF